MTRYDSNFREPPWVMGSPKEVLDWVDASHPDRKKKHGHKKEEKYLKNLHIRFDLDVSKKEVEPPSFLSKLTGRKWFEEGFDLLPTTELILRALAKAKFRNTAKILVDGKIIYQHPEKKSDLRKTIDVINDFSNEISRGKCVEITGIIEDVRKCTVSINIKKIHSDKEHSIEIKMQGEIREENYHIFVNYLNEKIGLKD